MKAADIVKYPFWTLGLATGAKSFRDNKVIGSPTLNRWGLHRARVKLAHDLAWSRRRRLQHLIGAEDREAFRRDGFIAKRNYLDPAAFTALRDQVLAYRGPAREMIQGDAITRRIAIDGAALRAMPLVRELIGRPDWKGMMRYVSSFDQEPLYYIQTILNHVNNGGPDPQTNLHEDTFHPSMKAWFFLTDVAEDEGPFTYVPGSHLLTPERLDWITRKSIDASHDTDSYSARGSFRIRRDELPRLGLKDPVPFAVPANTLVVGDTVGFHARGFSARPSRRVEIWAYSRRNPFLPWTGFDPLSLPDVAEARIPAMWSMLDKAQSLGLARNSWVDKGLKHPLDD